VGRVLEGDMTGGGWAKSEASGDSVF